MKLQVTRVYAVLVSILAILGLFVSGHLFGLMNTDTTLDLIRLLLAIYLIYAAFISKASDTITTALMVVGVLYLGMGLLAIITPTLGGVLPGGLTGFDVVFHLATGALATYFAAHSERHRPAIHH